MLKNNNTFLLIQKGSHELIVAAICIRNDNSVLRFHFNMCACAASCISRVRQVSREATASSVCIFAKECSRMKAKVNIFFMFVCATLIGYSENLLVVIISRYFHT